ncbi:MAG: hypothetical protein BWY82_01656 [Verrucomicrobia bacterium ADurb.Bin474]|nr:MAG: hypothetical protein BWY82_01656 [Verrucomicrobia bacterium ADurb.Bin474]
MEVTGVALRNLSPIEEIEIPLSDRIVSKAKTASCRFKSPLLLKLIRGDGRFS